VPVGPLPLLVYVREYVPPATSRLEQQLALPPPQVVIPAPPGAQLGGLAAQEPLTQKGVAPLHAVPACHWPLPLQVCGVLPMQVVCPGPHTPPQAPLTHVWLDPHAEPLFCHWPAPSQVCGCWPLQLSCPCPQSPPHAPAVQVWLALHAAPLFCQLPVASHFWGCWPLH
jgi:hypothetical protein